MRGHFKECLAFLFLLALSGCSLCSKRSSFLEPKEKPPRPLIGVTVDSRWGWPLWLFLRTAVWQAGGRPVRITTDTKLPERRLDGLILGGGRDINPAIYSQKPTQKTAGNLDIKRDTLERALLRDALARRIPILGICRGHQLLNVIFGGTLHQEVLDTFPKAHQRKTILPVQKVFLVEGTKLRTIMNVPHDSINGLHRQVIAALGKALNVSAYSKDGIIEAMEHQDLPFVLGVQWHPELMLYAKRHRNIFRALVDEAISARVN